mgnify:CR=1 FL=1
MVLACIVFLMGVASAAENIERQWDVVDWDSAKKSFVDRTVSQSALLLNSEQQFSTKNFSIHKNFSDEVFQIPERGKKLSSDAKLELKRASTLAFQLNKIEAYFTQRLREAGLNEQVIQYADPVKIRFDAAHEFSPTHYYDPKEKRRNTALSIPPSDANDAKEYIEKNGHGWKSEIWFAPMLSIPLLARYSPDRVLDVALCPDVIYHEYAHLVTGAFIGKNVIGSALSEGLSDYFAASMIDHPALYGSKTCPSVKWQLFVNAFRFDKNTSEYSPAIEENFKSNLHFVPSVLWQYRKYLRADLADKVILRAVSKSSPKTRIYPEFVQILSDVIFEEIKSTDGEETALALLNTIEQNVIRPRALMTSFGENDTIFPDLPRYQIEVQNPDNRSSQVCKNENRMVFYWDRFSRVNPKLYVEWFCDGLRVPMKVQFPLSPFAYLTSKFQKAGALEGRISMASPAAKIPSKNLSAADQARYARLIKYTQEYYIGGSETAGSISLKPAPANDPLNRLFVLKMYYGRLSGDRTFELVF